jgi:tetratricopeptide (TPR) repeat protein
MDRHEEAKAAIARARELDPLLVGHHALSSQVAFAGRDYAGALQFARQAILVDPEFWIGYIQLAQAHAQLGKTLEAMNALDQAGALSGFNSKVLSLRGYLLARLGQRKEAEEVLNTLQAVSHERYVPPYATALVYAGLDQPEQATEWLERALEMRDVHLAFLTMDPKWDGFRGDSWFIALVKRCGFVTSHV